MPTFGNDNRRMGVAYNSTPPQRRGARRGRQLRRKPRLTTGESIRWDWFPTFAALDAVVAMTEAAAPLGSREKAGNPALPVLCRYHRLVEGCWTLLPLPGAGTPCEVGGGEELDEIQRAVCGDVHSFPVRQRDGGGAVRRVVEDEPRWFKICECSGCISRRVGRKRGQQPVLCGSPACAREDKRRRNAVEYRRKRDEGHSV